MTRTIHLIGVLVALISLPACVGSRDTAPGGGTVKIGFMVTVPSDTPGDEPVYLSGNNTHLGNWDGKGLALEREDDGTYHGTLTIRRGARVEFKATRGSWDSVEKNQTGGEIDNRYVIADADKQVEVVVASWASGVAEHIDPTLTGDIRLHEKFRSDILGNDRTLIVYLPPGYGDQEDRRYPVLFMHDGQNIFDASTSFAGHEWEVDEAAERLINGGEIEPIIIVGMYNNAERMHEYSDGSKDDQGTAYTRFVVEEVKPFIDRTYRTAPARERTGIAGSSLGGLISLYMAREHADVFDRCAVVSPALGWQDRRLLDRLEAEDTAWMHGTRFWVDMGTVEGHAAPGQPTTLAVEHARDLAGLLKRAGLERGVQYEYLEVEGGRHNEQAWAQRIEQILVFLYGSGE